MGAGWSAFGGIDWLDDGDMGRLLVYSPKKVLRLGFLPIFTPWLYGTVLSKDCLAWVVFYMLINILMCYNAFDMSHESRRHYYHMFTHLLEEGPIKLTAVVVFPLGLFMSSVISRHQGQISAYNQICAATCDVALNISTLAVPKDDTELSEQLIFLRSTVVRYLLLGQRFTVLQTKGRQHDFEQIQKLVDSKLLEESEMQLLEGLEQKDMHVYRWLAQLIRNMLGHPSVGVAAPVMGRVHDKCLSLMTKSTNLAESVQVKLPYNYFALLAGLVRVYLLAVAMQNGLYMSEFGKDFFHRVPNGTHRYAVKDDAGESIICYAWVVILAIFFNGVLELYSQLDAPFSKNPLHISTEKRANHLEASLRATMYQTKDQLPPEVANTWGCAMTLPPDDSLGFMRPTGSKQSTMSSNS
jgi:hypothetical protein